MAITAASRGTAAPVAGTTFDIVPSANCTAGALVELWAAYDNSAGIGSAPVATVADTKGNTWTSRETRAFDPGAANEGVVIRVWTTDQAAGTLTTGDTVTVTFSVSAKCVGALRQYVSSVGTVVYSAGAVENGANQTSPTTTTDSLASGQAVSGCCGAEDGPTFIADSDTTNGSWEGSQTAGAGASPDDTEVSLITQVKIVTGAGTQTYNPTHDLADSIIGWISYSEQVSGPPVGTLSLMGVGR